MDAWSCVRTRDGCLASAFLEVVAFGDEDVLIERLADMQYNIISFHKGREGRGAHGSSVHRSPTLIPGGLGGRGVTGLNGRCCGGGCIDCWYAGGAR